jgi:tetratricopeptide (TPR) repeat protein
MPPDANKAVNAAEIDRLATALAKEPGSKAFIPLAEEYGKAGMWEEAAAVLEDGLKTYPNFITAMVALGRAYDQLNQPVKAKAVLEEAVKLSPENLRAHRTLAKLYVAQGAKEAALRSCNVILAVNPQDQEALSFRATLGASGIPPSTGRVTPLHAGGPGKTDSSTSASSEDQTSAGVTQTDSTSDDAEEPPVPVPPSTKEERGAKAAQLERWLSSIQARRKDRERPAGSGAPTS